MNWFQIVFLREQSQACDKSSQKACSCELVSNCIFTWAITSVFKSRFGKHQLWIGFKLYFYVSNHKLEKQENYFKQVVNWFQIVFLREQSQVNVPNGDQLTGCELVSNCIFTWAITSETFHADIKNVLWIGFKLYFYVSNHKIEE